MVWPSKGDFRFLTAVRNDRRAGWNDRRGVRNDSKGAPPPLAILKSALPPCHSEERTTKNLRCLLMRWDVVIMDQPSEGDLRFLTAVGNDGRGVGITVGAPPPLAILRSALSSCHSEECTTKNLRLLLMRWVVVVMGWPSEGDFRFLTAFGMTGGEFGMTAEGLG